MCRYKRTCLTIILLAIYFSRKQLVCVNARLELNALEASMMTRFKLRFVNDCDRVCKDLPVDDTEPVCVMFSRYKKGYQFFINQCHARRAICTENLVLHMVHPSRCVKSRQFFKPIA